MKIAEISWRSPALLTLLAAFLLPTSVLALAGGSSAPSVEPLSEMTATDYYNQGLKYRDKAWALEEKAAAASGEKEAKYLKKAGQEYEKAVKAQRRAVKEEPRMFQAHSSLGYALRKVGEYEESIEAYNKALELEPRYTEAIEYRAEAFLGLNRLDEVKEAYMHLFRADRERADELLGAMQNWVEAQRAARGGQEVEDFAAWVDERTELAAQTAMVGSGRTW